MKKTYIISPLYLLSILKSAYSQGETSPELREMFAGYWINFENQKNCTASFVVNKQGVNGLLTSAQCCVNNNCLNGNIFDTAYENEDDGNVTKIGQVHDAQFGGANGLDYAFVSLDSVDWKPFNYVAGLTANDTMNNGTITELYPVTSDFTPTEPGLTVCASSQGSGYNCGNLTELDLTLLVSNPWNNNPTILKGLNKVDLGTNGFESKEDIGGPVYVQSNNVNGTTTVQALGHIVATNNDDPNHKFLYYLPINKILVTKNINLATYNSQQESVDKSNANATIIKHLNWNSTISKMDKKDREIWAEVYVGKPVDIFNKGFTKPPKKQCTLSFPVKMTIHYGILTAGHCAYDNSQQNIARLPLRGGQKLGYTWRVVVGGEDGNDYAFIQTGGTTPVMIPVPCIAVPRSSWGGLHRWTEYLAVTTDFAPHVGAKVCAVGRVSGFGCGEIIRTDVTMSFGDGTVLKGFNKVDTGKFSFIQGDSGGPVFIQTGKTAQAVGHISIGLGEKNKNGFYYVPIKKILSEYNFELLTANEGDCPTTESLWQKHIQKKTLTKREINNIITNEETPIFTSLMEVPPKK